MTLRPDGNGGPSLYHPSFEHGSCGVGFVADARGRRSHELVRMGLDAAANLAHRGAVSGDGLTGDGAGVMTQVPTELLRRELERQGVNPPKPGVPIGIGMLFLPHDDAAARAIAERIVRTHLGAAGLRVLMWRHVPIDTAALGEEAKATCPAIRQVVVSPRKRIGSADEFERVLYIARRRIENAAAKAGLDGFTVCSLSARTVVYKGLVVTPQLASFYRDLADPAFASAMMVFHQRFSTNTFPSWKLAQPLRMIAHNGEINSLRCNVSWVKARQRNMRSPVLGDGLRDVLPVVDETESDSATFDRVYELLVMAGRSPQEAMSMLVPPAIGAAGDDVSPEVRDMVRYHSLLVEPWDGPASMVFCDGVHIGASLDRNGLRPVRYAVTDDGLIVAGSEAGIVDLPAASVIERGKLGPGQMLLVDTESARVLRDAEVKTELASSKPYGDWVGHQLAPCAQGRLASEPAFTGEDLTRRQRAFGYSREDVERIIGPMAELGTIPVGSMGDDTPLAVLSDKPQSVFRYFKQKFAQVTNPPLDPIRESCVMSLWTPIGAQAALLRDQADHGTLISIAQPVLTPGEAAWIETLAGEGLVTHRINAVFSVAQGPAGLDRAIGRLCEDAERAIDEGATALILSDRMVAAHQAAIPSLLALSSVHQHLIRAGKRLRCSLIVESGEAREDHHIAALIGFGATLVSPYLAMSTAMSLGGEAAAEHYRDGLCKGLLKIMSKMGVADILSYRASQMFEAIGLSQDLLDEHFTGTIGRLGGAGLDELATDALRAHAEGFGEDPTLRDLGIYRYRKDGEYHAFNPGVFKMLHKAVRTESAEAFAEYAKAADEHPACNVRDLLRWKTSEAPVPLEEVEPLETIVSRFCTQAMSHGAVSREQHEVLGIAMNRLGGKSNSGEGGESRSRFRVYEGDGSLNGASKMHSKWQPERGDLANSRIKQVATGRFGVTPEYLVHADEIEIKMCQGAKPGEGGQIPGFKVTDEIAELRRAQPGQSLISPPPHHDIYSIEDLEQLIYDLKRVNKDARVCVKLAASTGVGTIAAGVAKAYADSIQISGHDGGTGASPLGSIKHAGMPWELGLAETQQTLVINNLRGRVLLRVDGGMRTGRDVVIAALLGGEEFGFGTAALIASGCVMARKCHENTCPVGVASQRDDLRAKFPGRPEHVINFMIYVAQQVRMILGELGVRSMDEIIGRSDLLEARDDVRLAKPVTLDLAGLLAPPPSDDRPIKRVLARNTRPEPETPLGDHLWRDAHESIQDGSALRITSPIDNRQRSVAARIAGELARAHGEAGLPDGTISIEMHGAAGQSFGAFSANGLELTLIGEANDYVGKGMNGGRIVVRPPAGSSLRPHEHTIMGNTVLYGGTGGELFAAGRAGERLCVRNSGSTCVVEGAGDHACEYMTGGVCVILGSVGRNFGAGMTGGAAYVLDDGVLESHLNAESVELVRLSDDDIDGLLKLLTRHAELTGSERAAEIVAHWPQHAMMFRKVTPRLAAEQPAGRSKAVGDGVADSAESTAARSTARV
ncbi:MAG: glutamate synthase large subunit [Planctomycetota bacterium]